MNGGQNALIFFFFLMIRRPPRSTPFPTRRSSDLDAHKELDEAVLAAYGWPLDATDEDILTRLLRLNVERDRKSTRLNSSHVRISYAVFCLKKKNTFSQRWKHDMSQTNFRYTLHCP